jgi:hypothetical protein
MGSEFPFRLRGDDGVIRVSVTRNEEPARWGWRLLGLDVPLDQIVGFPVVEATVDHPGEGYLTRYPDWEWRSGWAS